ncbi:flagellar hook-associated protein FlgL [Solirubrobacter sp. CPCC 204708]|uniref:Flagellar hook-associated protein FlgL n=1 Tax=Solirubrobacter deserti TaxID=2282478 RepID=A0ABT4RML6_9ACTN|nr:flagellar hook-associated protein FlgL [Solirubrobacter deserti]MBE2316953.1 flagellar hook-associated protein FlgL [Solirubrobacter deserti]MDA0139784.1 flagellar hook-associated protein FlgL [Solirubrobacter deserti]
MRITTSMIQRNVLSDLNLLSEKMARTQSKASSGKEITRPSDDPFNTARAMGLRQTMAANDQYKANISDAQGWQDATESALDELDTFVDRANVLVLQGSTDTADAESRKALAQEIDQIIQGVKQSANTTFGDSYLMAGTATNTPPYKLGDDDTYQGDDAGLDPSLPGVVREIGPGVTMSINVVGRELLGDGGNDGKLLSVLRNISTHLKNNDSAALQGTDTTALKANLDSILNVRARNGAMTNRLDSAAIRIDQIQGAVNEQLTNTEAADFAKTMIEFSQQSAAYQASLRAGANIVQSSLMDFLR